MKVLQLLFVVFLFANYVCGCNAGKVTLSIVSQRSVAPTNDGPLLMRELTMRIANNSGCSVFVKGHEVQKFFPIGVYMRFDRNLKKWRSPFGHFRIPRFNDLGFNDLNVHEIKNGGSLEFTSLVEEADYTIRFRRVVYVSIESPQSMPRPIISSTFRLYGQLN
jgi:hypothetical protein